jgi:opacity protein-like surface antigen
MSFPPQTRRIGYAVNFEEIAGLFYLKGGAAFVNYDKYGFSGQSSLTACNDPKTCATAGAGFNFNGPSSNRWGWTIGFGTEWVVDGNWSIFGEWDYLNFGSAAVPLSSAGQANPFLLNRALRRLGPIRPAWQSTGVSPTFGSKGYRYA